jgi:hypothetical protein
MEFTVIWQWISLFTSFPVKSTVNFTHTFHSASGPNKLSEKCVWFSLSHSLEIQWTVNFTQSTVFFFLSQ